MDGKREGEVATMTSETTTKRISDQAITVGRTFDAPARIVWEAWTRSELFKQWWVPKSCGVTLLSCEMDVRVGGKYCLVFRYQESTMEFFGIYREVTPPSRLVWTNEEGADGETVTTVTFDEQEGKTLVVVHDRYASKEALDVAISSGSTSGMPETLAQLEDLLIRLRTESTHAG
jgi:uncharacterized protein YndB with AHSA1/START domain